MTRFDSILVRLKDRVTDSAGVFIHTFRFHTGSIKSFRFPPAATCCVSFDSILVRLKEIYLIAAFNDYMFRFHTGSIKSDQCRHTLLSRLSFDSILVRLKDL